MRPSNDRPVTSPTLSPKPRKIPRMLLSRSIIRLRSFSRNERSPYSCRSQRLRMDRTVPTHPHQLRNTPSIASVRLHRHGANGCSDMASQENDLEPGSREASVLYRLPRGNLRAQLGKLFRREFTVEPQNSIPRWISVESEHGALRALAFVMNRGAPTHVGRLPPEEIAGTLTKACGHWAQVQTISGHRRTPGGAWHSGPQFVALARACRRADQGDD